MAGYDNSIFAHNLTRLMHKSGDTQSDISNLLNVSKSTASSWCNGQKIPRMGKVEELAHHFGVQISDLIEEKPAAPKDDEHAQAKIRVLGMLSRLTPDNLDLALAQIDFLLKRQEKH